MKATRLAVAAALAVSALLAGCASRAPEPLPVIARGGDQPPQQAAVVAPRAYCPGPGFEQAAKQNAMSLRTMEFSPFGRAERGWEIYAPGVAQQIGSECPPETAQFAEKLAEWQGARGVAKTGVVDVATFGSLKSAMQQRRPFLKLRGEGLCPDSPDELTLAQLSPAESRWDKPVKMRPGALASYRRMVAAARRDIPQLAVESELMRVFSAYRSPESDGARCATQGNCNGLVRAACSAHRTGLAMDIMVGHAPGSRADSSEDYNRLYQSRTAVYRWMITNAHRFGFVNYPFEPWHWEWTGETMIATARPPAPSATGMSYARPPAAAPAYAQAAAPSQPASPIVTAAASARVATPGQDPIAALLTPGTAAGGGEDELPSSPRTYAQSWPSAPSPPRPSSPADPGPPGL